VRINVLGNPSGDAVPFLKALRRHCRALTIGLELVGRHNSPAVTVVFPAGLHGWTSADEGRCEHLSNATHPVIPIVGTAPQAALLPRAVRRFNAFQQTLWGTSWYEGLIDEVLSHAWLRRRERRIFLSYKRTDSQPIANQLHDALTRRGYTTFLDDISIQKGLDFQGELKWWLNDADLLLVLLSPNFEESPWCMEEIAFAQGRAVPLVIVEWPDAAYTSTPFAGASQAPNLPSIQRAASDEQRQKLDDAPGSSDFDGPAGAPLWDCTLTDQALIRILAVCARERSKAIQRRMDDLVPFAEEMLAPNCIYHHHSPGDFTFSYPTGQLHFVRVLPHRPTADSVKEAFSSSTNEDVAGCFYSECDPTDPRAEAIRWLSDAPRSSGGGAKESHVWAFAGDKEL